MKITKRERKDRMIKLNIRYSKKGVCGFKFRLSAIVCKAVLATHMEEGFSYHADLSVTFCNNEFIRELNREHRGKDVHTDVLSFPMGEDGSYDVNPENGCLMLGDIVISIDHAIAQAELFGHSIEREIAYLTVHSMFHLMGYDHLDEGAEKKLMRAKEEAALSLIGLEII